MMIRGIVSSFLFMILLNMSSPGLSVRLVNNFDVIDFGAVGNGLTDDSQAFLKAWGALCGAPPAGIQTLIIPRGKTFLLQPLAFQGPCNSNRVHVKIVGTLVAPSMNAWRGNNKDQWIKFSDINGLIINGGGQIDGRGATWWQSCKSNSCERPTALFIHNCNGCRLVGLRHLNSAKNHISINACNGFYISNLTITAPGDSPNTDGIDLGNSQNVNIERSFIGTGDDCIAINGGSRYMNITDVTCGPGHGISIGSLGAKGAYDTVEEVHVQRCRLIGTQNGLRIKTWEGGSGYARKISFEQITLEAVRNPIIINQHYSCVLKNNKLQQSSVVVSDVTYRDVHGSSADDKAIVLDCSMNPGCRNIIMDNIRITSSVPGRKPYAVCDNAHGSAAFAMPFVRCLT